MGFNSGFKGLSGIRSNILMVSKVAAANYYPTIAPYSYTPHFQVFNNPNQAAPFHLPGLSILTAQFPQYTSRFTPLDEKNTIRWKIFIKWNIIRVLTVHNAANVTLIIGTNLLWFYGKNLHYGRNVVSINITYNKIYYQLHFK